MPGGNVLKAQEVSSDKMVETGLPKRQGIRRLTICCPSHSLNEQYPTAMKVLISSSFLKCSRKESHYERVHPTRALVARRIS
jgi:hypothetical protein